MLLIWGVRTTMQLSNGCISVKFGEKLRRYYTVYTVEKFIYFYFYTKGYK